MLLLLAVSLVESARASDGAYVVGPADASLYLGLDAERITRLAGADGSGADTVIDVDEGLSKLTGKAILSYGLAPRLELELTLPYGYNRANRTDGPLCTALGEACATTKGVGVIEMQAKGLVFDELAGAPLSVALGGEARFGQHTWNTRNRLTNLGEGTFDVGGLLGLGRSGGLGSKGYWAASATAGARYRFPNTDAGGTPIPGWETDGRASFLFAPTGTWSFGPQVAWFFRPEGTDVETSDLADPDWLGALRVEKVAAGGAVHLRARQGVVLTASVLHNAWVVNNPVDSLLVSTGVQIDRLGFRKEAP